MRGNSEDSRTKRKRLSYMSTDGFALYVDVDENGAVNFSIEGEDGTHEVELSRAEGDELARFIQRGL